MSLNILGDKKIAVDANDVVENGIDIAFIPKGARNPDDYKKYMIRVFKTVPMNSALVCENVFTGKAKSFGSGFKIIAPWNRSKLMYVGDTQIDYPTHKYLSHDGIQMAVDYTLNLRIINPVKFEFNNQDALLALNQLTEDLMRVFVANHDCDNLFGKSFSIIEIDPGKRYERFAKKYGLLCFDILFKCDIPQSLKDDYEKRVAQQRANESELLAAQNRLDVARLDAQIKDVTAEAEASAVEKVGEAKARVYASKIQLLFESLRDYGLREVDLETVRSILLTDSNANVFATFGSGDIAKLSAGIAAGLHQRDVMKNSSLPEHGAQVVHTQQEGQERGIDGNSHSRRR